MPTRFEWNTEKADTNLRRHGVGFAEAQTVFKDDLSVTVLDPHHSDEEERWITIGQSSHKRLLVVVHTGRGKRIRLISARPATRAERQKYEKEDFT
jgi:uncharacterized protein